MAEENDDDMTWPSEEINSCVMQACEQVLESVMWDESKVPFWINEICEKTMQSLLTHNFPFKFIVTCMLLQKTERPLYGCFSMHWENNIDGIE